MTPRDVQLSLLPGLERPVGHILGSVFAGSNADLIAAVAPLYLTGHVCDVTYGRGKWWTRFRPDPFTFHDEAVDGVDFTALPHPPDTFDAVTFDPPYVVSGGLTTSTTPEFRHAYGLTARSGKELWTMIAAGLAEAARVTRPGGFVLVKCGDQVDGGNGLTLGHRRMLDMADRLGLTCHDLIVHHTGPGPGGHNIFVPKRARRHHSYLLVFTRNPQ